MSETRKIFGAVGFTSLWFKNQCGLVETDPFVTDPDELAEQEARKAKILHERYPDLPIGDPDPVPVYSLPSYHGAVVISVAYGAAEPTWDSDSASFWQADTGHAPLDWVRSPADVAEIRVPNWSDVRLVRNMIERYHEIRRRTKYVVPDYINQAKWPWKHPISGKTYRFSIFDTFVDLGPFLLGRENFLMILAGEPQLAHALMDKCFELSTAYSDFMTKSLGHGSVEALLGFGGDSAFFLSPTLYEEYGMGFENMLVEKYGNIPCNLHSCGPSKHLYPVWAKYPQRDKIVLMQTRGIPGECGKLRESLPHTFLQITLMPPQFDIEREDPDTIRKTVWQYTQEAGFAELQLVTYVSRASEKADRNLRAFYKAIDEVNYE